MMWKLTVLVLGCVQYACAYSRGAPARICDSMIPGHKPTPQTGQAPFTISAPVKPCEKDVTVTLAGSTTFRGFICQPRQSKDVAETSGALTPLGNVAQMKNNCETLTALCHTSNETKSSIQFKWTPVGNETVYIVCSFVEKYDTFWVKQSSGAVTLKLDDPSCSSGVAHIISMVSPVLLIVVLLVNWVFKDE